MGKLKQIVSLLLLGCFLILPGLFALHSDAHHLSHESRKDLTLQGEYTDCDLCDFYQGLSAVHWDDYQSERLSNYIPSREILISSADLFAPIPYPLRGPPAI